MFTPITDDYDLKACVFASYAQPGTVYSFNSAPMRYVRQIFCVDYGEIQLNTVYGS